MDNFFTKLFQKEDTKPKILCPKCGSDNITTTKKMKRTTGKPDRFRKISYGYCYFYHHCNACSNGWEGARTDL